MCRQNKDNAHENTYLLDHVPNVLFLENSCVSSLTFHLVVYLQASKMLQLEVVHPPAIIKRNMSRVKYNEEISKFWNSLLILSFHQQRYKFIEPNLFEVQYRQKFNYCQLLTQAIPELKYFTEFVLSLIQCPFICTFTLQPHFTTCYTFFLQD